MFVKFFSMALLGLIGLAIAQNAPEDFLRAHNEARSSVGVGPMTWDRNLAVLAQQHADRCYYKYWGEGEGHGQNIAGTTARQLNATAAVKMWVDEKIYYNYTSNSCSRNCGHYTQVVWRNSVRLGCGTSTYRCNIGAEGLTMVVCNYFPPGNLFGQKPY